MTMYKDPSGKEYSMDVLHKRLLGIMKYIDRIARENNIEYFLAYGTLIGAIRHKGFIPWDDDADLLIKRDEYYRLIDAIIADNDPRYKIHSMKNDPLWFTACVKVVDTWTKADMPYSKAMENFHLFVDIMPLDGLPETELGCKFHFALMTYYKAMATCADHLYVVDYERGPLIKKMLIPFAKIKGARYWGEKANNLALKRPYKTSKYVGYGAANSSEGHMTQKPYEKAIDWPFEDTKFMIPVGYHDILTGQFGNYMELPPEEARYPKHLYNIIDLGSED